MTMGGTVIPSPSWNPLRCGGTALPVNLLAMAKAIAIALLLSHPVRLVPDLFQRSLQIVIVTAAVALLFNRSVRVSASLLGMAMILSELASKAYYGNDKTYSGFILLLTGIYERRAGPWLIRLQVAIVYFGEGLNKLLDADWRTGAVALSVLLPAMWMAKLVSWLTIAAELGLSGLLLSRRLIPLAIWLSVCFQCGMLFVTDGRFPMSFYAMTASMLAFVTWPGAPLTVIYDGDCGFCSRAKRWIERFDLEGMFNWQPYQSGAGRPLGISDAEASQRFYLANGDRIYSGFGAFKRMALWNPLAYLVTYAVLAAPGARDSLFRNITIALLLGLFSPLFAPLGEAAYRLVARNRHRLSGSGANCSIDTATTPNPPQKP